MTVVPIRQGLAPEAPAGTVDPDVVKELEEVLDKARTGDVTGLAYVTLHPGGFTTHHRVGRMTRAVLGALMLLQYVMARADQDES